MVKRLKYFLFLATCHLMALSPDDLCYIEEHFTMTYLNEQDLPLVLIPKDRTMHFEEICHVIERHHDPFLALLKEKGAILFRHCSLKNSADFAHLATLVTGKEPTDYIGEGSRQKIAKGVYTSTEAPSWFFIPLHHELSCTDHPASYISFFCDLAPKQAEGHTILGFSSKITKAIQLQYPLIWKAFNEKTLRYTSRHPPRGSCFTTINKTHKPWQDVFETEDRQEVERICRERGYNFRWHRNNWLEVIRYAPAIKTIAQNQKYWLNQAHLYHRNPVLRGGNITHYLAEMLYFQKTTAPYDIAFEDGSPIPNELITPLYQLFKDHMAEFDWQKSDALIVDNLQVMHGKTPHTGERKIFVSLTP